MRSSVETDTAPAVEPRSRRERSRRVHRQARVTVALVAFAAAIGGALAGCHPTGLAGVDPLYGAAVAAGVTLAGSRAGRSSLLVLTAAAATLSRSWLLLPAFGALGLAFASTFHRRPHRRIGAIVAALGVEVLLRWPGRGFQGLTAVVAVLAVAPVLLSGWRHSHRRTRRWVSRAAVGVAAVVIVIGAPAALTALFVQGTVTRGMALARTSLDQVESGQGSTAGRQLQLAARDLSSAHSRLSAWWNAGAYLVPGEAQQERALSRASGAGAQVTRVAAEESGSLDFSALRFHGGRINVAAIRHLQAPVTMLEQSVRAAQGVLSSSGSPWLLPMISQRMNSVVDQVDKARTSLDLAQTAVKAVPAILGADGSRNYLVAVMTPAETRGLGGFIGAYGLLSVDNGAIRLTRTGRATQLVTDPNQVRPLTQPADYVARYGDFSPQTHFEDLTYAPDLPEVEQVMSQVYAQVGGQTIDGVLIVDPYSLAALLKFTGPVTVPGLPGPLTTHNAAAVLLRQQYLDSSITSDQRHDLLQEALDAGFRRLTSGSLPSPKALASTLGPEVRQGRLLFWSSHPADQALLQRVGLAGAFPQPGPGSDLLAVTVANGANSKIDAYLHQQVSDQVQYDPATGRVHSQVTITLQNAAPMTAPPYVIGSYAGSGLPLGTSKLWLSIYSPLALDDAAEGGQVLPFSDAIPEDGTNAYSTFVTIGPDSTAVVTASFDGSIRPGPAYSVALWQQPLANPQVDSVTLHQSSGWVSSGGTTWVAGPDQVQRHSWSFRPG
jgi:hypothetical protein